MWNMDYTEGEVNAYIVRCFTQVILFNHDNTTMVTIGNIFPMTWLPNEGPEKQTLDFPSEP